MIGIDTNILVRYITQDDPTQCKMAECLLEKYSEKARSIFINNIVLCELGWVLGRGYGYSKLQIIKALRQIFSTKEFAFEDIDILFYALENYERNGLDFADALILSVNNKHGYQTTYTLDAIKVAGFVIL